MWHVLGGHFSGARNSFILDYDSKDSSFQELSNELQKDPKLLSFEP